MIKEKDKQKKNVAALFERLHFEFGLEDVNHLYMLKPEALKRWCETTGTKLHYISFGLAMEGDIDYVMKKLDEEDNLTNVSSARARRRSGETKT